MWWFKKLTVPASNEVKQIEVIQTWEVRWYSRYDTYAQSVRPEVEVFTSEDAANTFKDSLVAAFKLIRHTSGTWVEVKKSKQS